MFQNAPSITYTRKCANTHINRPPPPPPHTPTMHHWEDVLVMSQPQTENAIQTLTCSGTDDAKKTRHRMVASNFGRESCASNVLALHSLPRICVFTAVFALSFEHKLCGEEKCCKTVSISIRRQVIVTSWSQVFWNCSSRSPTAEEKLARYPALPPPLRQRATSMVCSLIGATTFFFECCLDYFKPSAPPKSIAGQAHQSALRYAPMPSPASHNLPFRPQL